MPPSTAIPRSWGPLLARRLGVRYYSQDLRSAGPDFHAVQWRHLTLIPGDDKRASVGAGVNVNTRLFACSPPFVTPCH